MSPDALPALHLPARPPAPAPLLHPFHPFHNHTKALRRATPPAYNQPTCALYTHTYTRRPTRPRDGWPSPLGNAQKHYLSPSSPEERDALLKIDTLAPWQCPRQAPCVEVSPGLRSCSCGKVPPLNLVLGGWGGRYHRSTSSSFNTSPFILHYSESLRMNHSQHV